MMGKKSTTIKKLRPILEEANELKNNKNFVADKAREKLGFTYFPGGFLKRIK